MSSYRWFALYTGKSRMCLNEFVKAADFSAEDEWIVVSELSDSRCVGVYFRNTLISVNQQNGVDELSRSLVKSVVSVSYVATVRNGLCVVRIGDSSRLAGAFISLLARALGFEFSFKVLHARPVLNYEHDIFRGVDSFRLVGLKLADVAAAPNVVARLEFASKYGMSLSCIPMVPSSGYIVSMAKYELVRSGAGGTVSIFSSGRFSVTGKLGAWVVDFIQEELINYE